MSQELNSDDHGCVEDIFYASQDDPRVTNLNQDGTTNSGWFYWNQYDQPEGPFASREIALMSRQQLIKLLAQG